MVPLQNIFTEGVDAMWIGAEGTILFNSILCGVLYSSSYSAEEENQEANCMEIYSYLLSLKFK